MRPRLPAFSIRSIVAGLALSVPVIANAGVVFSDGLEGYTSAADAVAKGPWSGYDQAGATVTPSRNYAHTGSQSLRICYPSNESQAYMLIKTGGLTRVFLRWWELRERAGDFSGATNYDWAGEKFNRLRSATIGSTGVDYPLGWSAAGGTFGGSGVNEGGMITSFGNSTASNGSEFFNYNYAMRRGEWHMFELEENLGTAGSANGAMRLWVDDKLVAERTGLSLLPKGSAKIDDIWIGGWYSGNGNPATPACRYVDDIVVSDQKIGGSGSTAPTVLPNPPSSVSVQ